MILESTGPARLRRALVSLEGLSVGDALGERFFGPPGDAVRRIEERVMPPAPWHYTDDTEMALAIVEVLQDHGQIDQDALAAIFAARFVARPNRGYGGTAREILRDIHRGGAWRDVSAAAFDGAGSRGNGAAMRVAPLGAYFADDLASVVREATLSAEVTHAHPDGIAGAIAIAVAAAWMCRREPGELTESMFRLVLDHTPRSPTRDGVAEAAALHVRFAQEGEPAFPIEQAVQVLGNGSGVIASDTVPFCLWSAARNLDSYEEAFWATVRGLGDRDTTCAIVGGMTALNVGVDGIPATWRAAREPLELQTE